MKNPLQFPASPEPPASWYYACAVRALSRGPVRVTVGGQSYVVFKTDTGQVAVLQARCVHMGADLSRGTVVGQCLRCPFHEWEFAGDGTCTHIPASPTVPDFARQQAYPVTVCGGHVFFCNAPRAPFEWPFFEGVEPADVVPARPFTLDGRLPWYMIGANGFDAQHFRAAHDRTLIDEPVVTDPHPFARRIRATFEVAGPGVRDRLTRRFAGRYVTMTVTSWSGTIILVTAEFEKMTTYGLVCVTPVDSENCLLHTIVSVRRSNGRLGRTVFDPINAAVRRSFIKAFLRSDQSRLDGCRYTPGTLIGADATLADYFQWLGRVVQSKGEVRCSTPAELRP